MRTGFTAVETTVYDVALVGSGIACSMTLCELATRLSDRAAGGRTLRIAVIEKEGEMWNGIPYGRRSAFGALAFQRLKEFLPEPELTRYIQWLATNADSWLKTFRQCGGPSAARWISDNERLMERGEWEELYLPRFLFGQYISSNTGRALERLSRNGVATVTLIHGEATGISRPPGRPHIIAVENSMKNRATVHAARVVLAIGSPPQRSVKTGVIAGRHGHTHIDNIYSPSENASVSKIKHALATLPDRRMANILVVGSNASALEVLYLLNYCVETRRLINSIVVLSRSGLLPYKICQEPVQFELTALESLCGRFSAADLMAAITTDIGRAEQSRVNIADLRDPVSAAVGRLTALMHISEQKKFVCEHGIHYSRLMRRAGRDTRTAADELVGLGILTTVQGELRTLEPSPSSGRLVLAAYATAASQANITHPAAFSISINCGGFEELDLCSNPLINSSIENGICTPNSTNRGFLVNDRLEASENVYVIGPLVGGNFNDKVRFWHVESAARISSLAKLLAESLADSLFVPGQYSRSDRTDVASGMSSSFCPPGL